MLQIQTLHVEFSGEHDRLNDAESLSSLLHDIGRDIGLTVLDTLTHQFDPQGISLISLLSESHIALHTWPEIQRGYIVLTTCKWSGNESNAITGYLFSKGFTVTRVVDTVDGVAR